MAFYSEKPNLDAEIYYRKVAHFVSYIKFSYYRVAYEDERPDFLIEFSIIFGHMINDKEHEE